jgi:spermidine/putrescine transport system permease protein
LASLLHRFGPALGGVFAAIVLVWLLVLVLAPNLFMIDFAFRPNLMPSQIGGPQDVYSLGNFTYLVGEPIHRAIFLKTIFGSILVTLVTLCLCYPIAYFLAQMAQPRTVAVLLLLLLIPFWINEVLRTLAWYIILAFRGPLNAVLQALGIIDAPLRYFGDGSVLVGMAYAYVLFMLFPIYTAISSLDRNQIEAANDLGASTARLHWRVVIPHAKAGIATGCMFTFMLAAGSYIAPSLLGAPGSRWFTEIIYSWFFEGGDWNRGSAYALALLVTCLAFIMAMLRVFRVGLSDVAR